jgi:hypothetical protein
VYRLIHGDLRARALQIKELRVLDTALHSLIDRCRYRIPATGMPQSQRTQIVFIVSAALLTGAALTVIAAQSPPKPATAMVVYKSAT